MRLPRLMLALLLVFSGLTIYSQDIVNDYKKTETTAFPISISSGWYRFAGTDKGDSFFMSSRNLNVKEKINAVWVRWYDFKFNIVIQALWTINRTNETAMVSGSIKYNLTTGMVIPTEWSRPAFEPIGPDTIVDGLLSMLNSFENTEKEQAAAKKKPKG